MVITLMHRARTNVKLATIRVCMRTWKFKKKTFFLSQSAAQHLFNRLTENFGLHVAYIALVESIHQPSISTSPHTHTYQVL